MSEAVEARISNIFKKIVDETQITWSQDVRTTFKQILACIFLSVRVNLKNTLRCETPCTWLIFFTFHHLNNHHHCCTHSCTDICFHKILDYTNIYLKSKWAFNLWCLIFLMWLQNINSQLLHLTKNLPDDFSYFPFSVHNSLAGNCLEIMSTSAQDQNL